MTMASDVTQTSTLSERLFRFMAAARKTLLLVQALCEQYFAPVDRRVGGAGRAPLGQLGAADLEPLAGHGLDLHHVMRSMRSTGGAS